MTAAVTAQEVCGNVCGEVGGLGMRPDGTVDGVVLEAIKTGVNIGLELAANQAVNPGDFLHLGLEITLLAARGGAHLYRTHGLKTQLAKCLQDYLEAGLLSMYQEAGNPKSTSWTTKPAFYEAGFLFKIYKDVEQYVAVQKITDAELQSIGYMNTVTLHASKKLPRVMQQLSHCCKMAGVRDVTETDLEKRIKNVSFPHLGLIAMKNAFIAEGERQAMRQRAGLFEDKQLVPVLGRVFSLLALCGIREINMSDMTVVLGKAPMFETVARSRIASLRNHHASHIINTVLFGGSTESAAKNFAASATAFKDDRVVVGRVETSKKAKFDAAYANAKCEFSGSVDKKHPVGTPIYMLAGWARLVSQREAFKPEHSKLAQLAHLHAPSTATDLHGNKFMHQGSLDKLTFKVKELPDGMLMAKPRRFDKFDYLGSSNYNKGKASAKATGQEKHFGGIVGPTVCKCSDPDVLKAGLTQRWKYGEQLKLKSRDVINNSIEHTKDMSTKQVSIFWRTGDWPVGVFLMQTLPQSSYLQGKGECLHCAVESAALAGCPEVIACGGGKVSEDARAAARVQGPIMPVKQTATAITETEVWLPSSPRPSIATPPPPYSGPSSPSAAMQGSYFAISDAQGDKVITVPPQDTPPLHRFMRRPVGSIDKQPACNEFEEQPTPEVVVAPTAMPVFAIRRKPVGGAAPV